ncbi:MAG: cupin domain-containing protein, partial [Bacteroidetes bacterium]|nr:cupin domain-containing protein [Bacteroidota bacterium]
VSALHRIQSDELWHFYNGDPLIIYEIEKSGKLTRHLLGTDPNEGQQLFTYIKAGSWFGAVLNGNSEYALVGCTVSPGFDYADFEMAERNKILT